MNRLAVRAHDVFCLYPTPRGHVAALRGLTLDVAAGERVVVHGPNGSGKTTLLRVLMGELAPSAGSIEVGGVDLVGATEPVRARLRGRRIGLVDQFHGRSLRPEISVLDNVALQLRFGGAPRGQARSRAGALLERLGLGTFGGRHPATLSGGEAQRVAVCAAVAHRPELILADEPTGELDRDTADEVYDLLVSAARASDAALVLVSHDDRATRVADRIVRMRDGRLSEEWAAAGSVESLVVDDRGWVRLPEPLRRRTGVLTRAHADAADGAIVLSPPGPVSTLTDAVAAVEPTVVGSIVARLDGVSMRHSGRTVLDTVDLTLRAGTLTVVQGRSGSGKTTLLRILCGLERPDSGTVVVDGTDLSTVDRAGLARLRRRAVAVSGQGTALLETMDVDENLDLVRLARHLDPAGGTEQWVAALNLTAVRQRPVRVLSGGERQRVAVARVLAAGAVVGVLDEPTSRQDEAHAELVVAGLVAAARRGLAIVAASHDPVLISAADAVLDLG